MCKLASPVLTLEKCVQYCTSYINYLFHARSVGCIINNWLVGNNFIGCHSLIECSLLLPIMAQNIVTQGPGKHRNTFKRRSANSASRKDRCRKRDCSLLCVCGPNSFPGEVFLLKRLSSAHVTGVLDTNLIMLCKLE